MATVDMELQNGAPKCTLIENFYGEASVVRPGFKQSFKNLALAQGFIKDRGWEVNISLIKGSRTFRDIQKGGIPG